MAKKKTPKKKPVTIPPDHTVSRTEREADEEFKRDDVPDAPATRREYRESPVDITQVRRT